MLGKRISKEDEKSELEEATRIFDYSVGRWKSTGSKHEEILSDILSSAGIKVSYEPLQFSADLFLYEMKVDGAIPVPNPHFIERDGNGRAASHDVDAIRRFTAIFCEDGGYFRHYFITACPENMLRGEIVHGLNGEAGEIWHVRNGIEKSKARYAMEKSVLETFIGDLKAKSVFNPNGRQEMIEAIRISMRLQEDEKLKERIFAAAGLRRLHDATPQPIFPAIRHSAYKNS